MLCTVCGRQKSAMEFKGKRGELARSRIRRCNGCRTCLHCKVFQADARHMVRNSRLCTNCSRATEGHICRKCGLKQKTACYDEGVLLHHQKHKRMLICQACQLLGYSPDETFGLEPHMCKHGHERGHLAFDLQLLYNVKRGHSSSLICRECQEKYIYQCAAPDCFRTKITKAAESFEDGLVEDGKQGRGNLVCLECAGKGYTKNKGGLVPHYCNSCDTQFGPGKFTTKDRDNKKQRPKMALQCVTCKSGRPHK